MLLLEGAQRDAALAALGPERPGPLVAPHVRRTGLGVCFVDRWPAPRAIVAGVAENYTLAGEPGALAARALRGPIAGGFVDAPDAFVPLLRETWPELVVWDRVIFELPGAPRQEPAAGVRLRRLRAGDASALAGLGDDLGWISDTLGGPQGLAASELAWGAFFGDALGSVATPFFLGERYEDIGIVTQPGLRGRGLAPACAARVAEDVRRRGRTPSWSTAPDNAPSLRVAAKLGFREQRRDRLYLIERAIPGVARRDAH